MTGDAALSGFRADLSAALARFRKLKTVHINQDRHKDEVRGLVQQWFREVRPAVSQVGVEEGSFGPVDAAMQALLRLAGGRSVRTNYVTQFRAAHGALGELEIEQEVALSARQAVEPPRRSSLEQAVIATLEALVPSAALSYRQVLADLAADDRVSYRGTANELRAVLWDVLDRLAPDADVEAAPGYKHEKDRTKPTQKQKARYILKSRSQSASARKVPETTVEILEGHVAALARAHYDRSSISTHLAAARAEVLQIKNYLDSLLAELLEVHSR